MTKVLITFKLTPAERDTLRQLAGGQQSEYLRALIAADAQARSMDWPSETADTRGKYPRVRPTPRTG